ncbi:formylglycine-generating enzyme family protein [Candidatus Latescibacterota bacterium]
MVETKRGVEVRGCRLRCIPPHWAAWRCFAPLLLGVLCIPSLSLGSDLVVQLGHGEALEFVWVPPPGQFRMGLTEDELQTLREQARDYPAFQREMPAHEVVISTGFYMAKYEITRGQWEAVMGSRPWAGLAVCRDESDDDLARCPASMLSYDSVLSFIDSLNQAAGAALFRLPTEAEWEYACRAGTTGLWSGERDVTALSFRAWFHTFTHTSDVLPVGSRGPNAWGLHDMLGNVWEWCQDWAYRDYRAATEVDPTAPASGSDRVVRGGNMKSDPYYALRSAFRGAARPSTAYGYDETFGAYLVRVGPRVTAVEETGWGSVKEQLGDPRGER